MHSDDSSGVPNGADSGAKPPVKAFAPLTPERKATFLRVLSETGSVAAASSAATPWAKDRHGGSSTFYDAMRRDPGFAEAFQAAKEQALATLEQEAYRRAMEPTARPVFSKGELVGQELKYDNNLLLRVLGRLSPDWQQRAQIEHSGSIEHAILAIRPTDVFLLSEDKRDKLLELLDEIADLQPDEEDEDSRIPS